MFENQAKALLLSQKRSDVGKGIVARGSLKAVPERFAKLANF